MSPPLTSDRNSTPTAGSSSSQRHAAAGRDTTPSAISGRRTGMKSVAPQNKVPIPTPGALATKRKQARPLTAEALGRGASNGHRAGRLSIAAVLRPRGNLHRNNIYTVVLMVLD